MTRKILIVTLVLTIVGALGYTLSQQIRRVAPESEDRAGQLDTLGYLSSVEDMDPREGVILHDEARAQEGLTLVTSTSRQTTYLVEISGEILHQWSSGPGTYAALDDAGYLFALRGRMDKLDWDSEVVWTYDVPSAHHDVWIGDDEVVVLTRAPAMVEGPFGPAPILSDAIAVLDREGRVKQRISVFLFAGHLVPEKRYEAIEQAVKRAQEGGNPDPLSVASAGTPSDVFHTNSVMRIDRRVEGVAEPGDLLVSVRELDLVAVIRPHPADPTNPEQLVGASIVWSYEGPLAKQHHATLLDDDNITIYDNGRGRGFTNVIEIDPRNHQVVWEYSGDPPQSLYSERRGSAQRLPNGNTLITEADKGRVIEVTHSGEVVWEYLMHKQDDAHREPVYRAIRTTGTQATALRERASKPREAP